MAWGVCTGAIGIMWSRNLAPTITVEGIGELIDRGATRFHGNGTDYDIYEMPVFGGIGFSPGSTSGTPGTGT